MLIYFQLELIFSLFSLFVITSLILRFVLGSTNDKCVTEIGNVRKNKADGWQFYGKVKKNGKLPSNTRSCFKKIIIQKDDGRKNTRNKNTEYHELETSSIETSIENDRTKVTFLENLNLKSQKQNVTSGSCSKDTVIHLPCGSERGKTKVLLRRRTVRSSTQSVGNEKNKVLATLVIPVNQVLNLDEAIIVEDSSTSMQGYSEHKTTLEDVASQDFYNVTSISENEKYNEAKQNTIEPLRNVSLFNEINHNHKAKDICTMSSALADSKVATSPNIPTKICKMLSPPCVKFSEAGVDSSPTFVLDLRKMPNKHGDSEISIDEPPKNMDSKPADNDCNFSTSIGVKPSSVEWSSLFSESDSDEKTLMPENILMVPESVALINMHRTDTSLSIGSSADSFVNNEITSLGNNCNRYSPACVSSKVDNVDNEGESASNYYNENSRKCTLYSGYSDEEDVQKGFKAVKRRTKKSDCTQSNCAKSKSIKNKHFNATKETHIVKHCSSQKVFDPFLFKSNSNLIKPIIEVGDKDKTSCEYCSIKFFSRVELQEHCKTLHSKANLFF